LFKIRHKAILSGGDSGVYSEDCRPYLATIKKESVYYGKI